MTEYQAELSDALAPRAAAAQRVPIAADRFIGVGAADNFLVSQTMTLKLETKIIFITRLYGVS